MKIYISGQITGLDIDQARKNFSDAEKIIVSMGHEPINPMKRVPYSTSFTWKDYMIKDIEILLKEADAIFMLSNYKKSKGARIEKYIAIETNKRIIYHK